MGGRGMRNEKGLLNALLSEKKGSQLMTYKRGERESQIDSHVGGPC